MAATMEPTQGLSPQAVQQVSDAVAQAIATTAPAGERPTITTTTGVAGSFDIQIVYGTTTYELSVKTPTGTGQPYVFSLTMTPSGKTAETLLTINVVPGGAWSVTGGLPAAIQIGPVTIAKLELSLSDS